MKKTIILLVTLSLIYFIPSASGHSTTIIAVGDSITQGYSASFNVTPYADPGILNIEIIKPYTMSLKELMPNATVINSGIHGQQTGQMLARFKTDVITQSPDYVVIQGGLNDIANGTPLATTENNLQLMYQLSFENGITPVATTVFYANELGELKELGELENKEITELDQWIATYSIAHKIPVVLFNATFEDPVTPLKSRADLISIDGVHPNENGYQLMAKDVYSVIGNIPRTGSDMLTATIKDIQILPFFQYWY